MTNNKTAVIRLIGGLGNQMFQYAAALGIAASQNRALLIDISSFQTYQKKWPYQLDCLQVPQNLYEGTSLGSLVSNSLKDRIVRKLRGGYNIYQEPHFHFDPQVFELASDEILLNGYFQSPLYFRKVEAIVRERFQPQHPFTATAQALLGKIKQAPLSVSLHVRRGDYSSGAALGFHGLLNVDYYHRSIALMKEISDTGATFFLFSDDPDYMEEVFSNLPNAHIVRSDPLAPWEDMLLMAHCQHNIIANSSYSWWGAWLNPNESKRVIAPAAWFAPDKLSTCNVLDLYPADWILMK